MWENAQRMDLVNFERAGVGVVNEALDRPILSYQFHQYLLERPPRKRDKPTPNASGRINSKLDECLPIKAKPVTIVLQPLAGKSHRWTAIPVSRETFDELSGPLVHTDFPWKQGTTGLVHSHADFPWNSYGPVAAKSPWKFWSTPALVHRVLFSVLSFGNSPGAM